MESSGDSSYPPKFRGSHRTCDPHFFVDRISALVSEQHACRDLGDLDNHLPVVIIVEVFPLLVTHVAATVVVNIRQMLHLNRLLKFSNLLPGIALGSRYAKWDVHNFIKLHTSRGCICHSLPFVSRISTAC